MRNKEVRLYNVLFPLWFLMIFPAAWLIVLPGNFLIDSLVLLISLRVLKIADRKSWYKRHILPIFGFGMLADVIGAAFLFLMMILGFRAMFHYWLASIALADEPQRSPNECIRVSYRAMRRRKLELFMLEFSFLGWMLLIALLSGFVAGLFGAVIGSTFEMLGSLLLTIYLQAALVCFYDAYAVAHPGGAAEAEGETNGPEEPQELAD